MTLSCSFAAGLPFLSSMEISMNFSESDVEETHVTVVPSILDTNMSARKVRVMSYNVPAETYVYWLDSVSTLSFNIRLCIIDGGRHRRVDSTGRERWWGLL